MVVALALGLYLYWGRHQWFVADEWDFLGQRSLGDPASLLRPHNEHWSTLPILVYRGLYSTVGLHTYVPYLLLLVLLHLSVAVLLFAVMLRARVRGWIAAAASTLFVFFGAGYENLLFAFQIGFVASIVFGLVQLLVADHDGSGSRRDWWALLAGLAALMSSGVGVTMVLIVGLAVLIRRGWRAAAFQTVPLAAVYLLWFVTYGHSGYTSRAPAGRLLSFTKDLLGTTFRSLGQSILLGVVLVAVLIFGLVLAWRPLGRRRFRQRAAAPAALLVGAVVFAVLTALGRALPQVLFFRYTEVASRYQYIVAALLLPPLAVAADGIGRYLGRLWPVMALPFLIGVPGNINVLTSKADEFAKISTAYQAELIGAARSPIAPLLPANYSIDPLGPYLTIGFLRDAARNGRLPSSPMLSASAQRSLPLNVALRLVPTPPLSACRPMSGPVVARFDAGTILRIALDGKATVTYLPTGEPPSPPRVLGSPALPVAYRLAAPLRLKVVPSPPAKVRLCP